MKASVATGDTSVLQSDRGVTDLLPTLGIAGGSSLDQQDKSVFVPRVFVTGGLFQLESATIENFSGANIFLEGIRNHEPSPS